MILLYNETLREQQGQSIVCIGQTFLFLSWSLSLLSVSRVANYEETKTKMVLQI